MNRCFNQFELGRLESQFVTELFGSIKLVAD